jgi:hypothetical protein
MPSVLLRPTTNQERLEAVLRVLYSFAIDKTLTDKDARKSIASYIAVTQEIIRESNEQDRSE